jgi:hypothetical protein
MSIATRLHEHVGAIRKLALDERGNVVRVARPLVIIGQPVLEVLKRSDVASAIFDPVVLVDADRSPAERRSSTSQR